jgi:hypothetical protein
MSNGWVGCGFRRQFHYASSSALPPMSTTKQEMENEGLLRLHALKLPTSRGDVYIGRKFAQGGSELHTWDENYSEAYQH